MGFLELFDRLARFRPGVLAGFALFASGCTRHLMTPPTRVGEFESPAVLEKGRKSLAVSAGADMALFYVNAGEVSAIGRLGLGDGLETGVTVSAMDLGLGKGHNDHIRSNPSPFVFA